MRITRHTDGSTDSIAMLRLMAPPETPYEPLTACVSHVLEENDPERLEDRNALSQREKLTWHECPWVYTDSEGY